MEDTLRLGGNIELAGFSEVERNAMIILKKIIGNYAKTFSEKEQGVELLRLTLKQPDATQFHIHAQIIIKGSPFTAETTEQNLFVATDAVLKEIDANLGK